MIEDKIADRLISLNAAYDRSHPDSSDANVHPLGARTEMVRAASLLERENRELRGDIMSLRRGIEDIINRGNVVLGNPS
jgi:hypothetical protein